MRKTRGWAGIRTSVVALGLVAAAAGVTRADPMTSTLLAYDTVGSKIGTAGVTGTPSVSFTPLTGGAFMSPSNLSLGMFQASALPAGQSVTYDNTPFDLKFNVDGFNGQTNFTSKGTPVDITGVLNGTLGTNQSTVVATFNPATYKFGTDLYTQTLTLGNNPISIVPSTSDNGLTTAQAVLSTEFKPYTPAPEPSTVVLFAATVAGLGFRQRLRRARAAA